MGERKPQCRWCARCLVLLILLFSPAVSAEEIRNKRETLEEINRRIEKVARNLEQKRIRELSLAADLQLVEKEVKRLSDRASSQQRKVSDLKKEIAERQRQSEKLASSVAELEPLVNRRLAAIYKGGTTGILRVLFGSGSPARMAEASDYLGRVVRRDRALLVDFRSKGRQLQETLEHLAELRSEQQKLLDSLSESRAALRKGSRIKEKLLARVTRDKKELSGQLEEMKARARRLSVLIKKLESEKAAEYTQKTPFAGQKGRLEWPVRGRVEVGFGTRRHPQMGTRYDSHGIEISVSKQEPIKAVWKGRVIFANPFKGYGNLILLDHGDGYYTLYAQASRLAKEVGDLVGQGEPLAFSGTEAVYFEIRHRGTPLDPADWLTPP